MPSQCRLLTIKVGVEGRVITGPAGGPGTVNVPLRIAVVHETLNPTTVATKFTLIPVTVNSAVDRVTFTHVEPDLTFPMPRPASATLYDLCRLRPAQRATAEEARAQRRQAKPSDQHHAVPAMRTTIRITTRAGR